jgi:hypothetical protein
MRSGGPSSEGGKQNPAFPLSFSADPRGIFSRVNIIRKRRLSLSKLTIRTIPLLFLLLLAGVNQASAQQVSAYFGLGSATDGATTSSGCASNFIYDNLNVPPGCEPAQTMGNVFGVIGGDVMIRTHLGINIEDSFRFAQAPYLPLVGINVRPQFYDFNAVYQPGAADSRIVPVVYAGVGGAALSFYANSSSCATSSICVTQSSLITNVNHFQVHGAFGVKLYFKGSMFIKPQVDLHYVPNLNQQYGSNFVPQYTVAIGYTFGR